MPTTSWGTTWPIERTRSQSSRRSPSKSPGKAKETNWVPAPEGQFSLYIRAYWAEQAVLNGTWAPPNVVRLD